jgi:dephospho-CoA kinase
VLVVGLTGGVGCGKSVAAGIFEEFGATIVDTDQIAHQLTMPEQPALNDIRRQFGAKYLLSDGNLDRAGLRRLIFSDPVAKSRLEAILHPLIKNEVRHRLSTVMAPYAIVAVPLLLETGDYRDLVQRILVVDCAEAQQIERVMARSQLTESEVRAIMTRQVRRRERLRSADDFCDNQGGIAALRSQIAELHQKYLTLSA